MSRFWNLGQPRHDEDAGDIESERDALQRSAKELEALKRELAQRVAGVQAKERELAEQLAQTGRVASELPGDTPPLAHDERAAELDALREQLEAREAAVSERERAVVTHESELEAREAALAELPDQPEPQPEPEPTPDRLAQIEAKLAELREAEKQFARTHTELAARTDALAEREAAVAIREQSVATREAPRSPELDELETRIRRLEQRSRGRTGTTQSFSSGLRTLEQRGVRRGDSPNEPLH